MDLRAALAVLGLEEGPELTRDQVRRTYMRKLREHPPERDPEGFKKLREAYEMARHMPDPEERERLAKLFEEYEAQQAEKEARKEPEESAADDGAPVEESRTDDEDDEDDELDDESFEYKDPFAESIEEVLTLVAEGNVKGAADKVQATMAELDERRGTFELTRLRWLLTRELVAVAHDLPQPITEALIAGIREMDFDKASRRVARYCTGKNRTRREVGELMTKRAPNLYNLVHVAFSDVPYTMAEGDGRRLLGWLAFLIAFLVFAGIQQCRKDATEREPAREPTLHVETDPAPWQLLIDDLVQLGDDTVAAPGQAAAAGVAVHSARSHDCAELRHAVTVLEKAAGPRDAVRAQQVANDIGKIRRRVDQLCAIELPRGSP